MRRFLVRLSKYSLVVFVIANLLAIGACFILKRSSLFKAAFLINQFDPKEKFNYFIIGSSRGLTSIGSEEIDGQLNLRGINLSQDDTGLPSQILMAKHFFESGFQANYCVLVLDDAHFQTSDLVINDNDYRMAPYLDRQYVYSYFQEREKGLFRPYTYGRVFPAIIYGYYNTELFLPSFLALIKPTYRHRFDKFGNYSYPESSSNPSSGTISKDRWKKMVSISNPILGELKSYLQSKNCELVIYIAPYQERAFQLRNEIGVPIINHSDAINDSGLFFDPIHLNLAGKKAASSKFAEEFKKIIYSSNSLN